jgi:cytochrome c peroxidase
MKKKTILVLSAFAASIVLFQACSKDTDSGGGTNNILNLPATPLNYITPFPASFANVLQNLDNTPANNSITNDGATLGRVLFYDKNLSKNNTISCASCHKQEQGFSDATIKSLGFEGGSTKRHSMPTLNLRFYQSGKMFWDERAQTLEQQVLMPIQDATEMGMTLPELVSKLQNLSYYPDLFRKAFGDTAINSDKISKALAQFLRSIVTYNSKYDQVKSGSATFTPEEAQGEQLFLNAPPGAPPGAPSCAGCHRPPMFLTSNPAGPFALADATDQGINNENRFKSGTLRNIEHTTPLFHNGAIPSLEAMLASNIPAHGVPPQDRSRIIAFLRTLTDNTVSTDVRFSSPFQQ